MSDLISRKETYNELIESIDWLRERDYELYCVIGDSIRVCLDEQPTAYDVDKVVEELKERKHEICLSDDDLEHYQNGIDDAIEIVKQGGISDDVCEWEYDYKFVSDKYKRETGCGHTFYDLHHAVPFNCPYCGKKIKIVGD